MLFTTENNSNIIQGVFPVSIPTVQDIVVDANIIDVDRDIVTPASSIITPSPARTPSWASQGTDVSNSNSILGALKEAGLDYQVTKVPLTYSYNPTFMSGGAGIMTYPVPDRMATIRVDNGEYKGTVSNKYEVIQNDDAFQFVEDISDELKFVKAGETSGGMIYVITRMPSVDVLGDTFDPYMIFCNSHNGTNPVKVCLTQLRIVCQNQFNFAFKNSGNTISIRHTQTAEARMTEAQRTMQMLASYMDELREKAEFYAGMKLSEKQVEWVLNTMFPDPDPDGRFYEAQYEKIQVRKQKFRDAYNADDNANFKGCAWGLINAYTDYITHKLPESGRTKDAEESRFLTTLKPMDNIINIIEKVA